VFIVHGLSSAVSSGGVSWSALTVLLVESYESLNNLVEGFIFAAYL
jgi:hypothetical protein